MKRMLAAFMLVSAVMPVQAEPTRPYNCLTSRIGCEIVIRIPDGQPGQILKFETCKPQCDPAYPEHPFKPGECFKTCDRNHKERGWETHYITPPDGEVCRNREGIEEALRWIEQHRPGWVWAGSGCVTNRFADM